MLRAAFWLTALVLLPAGLFLYFLPAPVAAGLGVSPLWLARVAGGLMVAWGGLLVAGGLRPEPLAVGALVAGNLLTVAALVPPALRLAGVLPSSLRLAMLSLALMFALLAVVGLLAPAPHRRLR